MKKMKSGSSGKRLGGDKFSGLLLEVDNGTVIVKCDDGKTRAVSATPEELSAIEGR